MADVRPKCIIRNLDEGTQLEAHFNPKEISIDKKVPWNKHKGSKGDNPTLEFTNAEPMTMSFELLFDTYEESGDRANVYTTYVQKLESFTLVIDRMSEDSKRPPMVTVIWGTNFPSFTGVIESLSTRYTMFFPDGTPCRATCSISLKQAESVVRKGQDKSGQSDRGTTSQEGQERRPDQLAGEGGDHRAVMDSSADDEGNIPPGSHVPGGAGS